MLESNRRGTLVLYVILALALAAALAVAPPPIGAALLAAYLLLIWLTARPLSIRRMRARVPAVVAKPRITSAGRAASEMAGRGGDVAFATTLLQDVGLIVDERSGGGLSLRHGRFISQDDESVRPYVVLHHAHDSYPRQALIRFEINDASGEKLFIYEMHSMIRPGENLIIPDYRLPLRGNDNIQRAGTWDLHVQVDGALVGIHSFKLMPSISQRLRNTKDGEIAPELLQRAEELPASLEELLGRQSK